MAFVEELIVKLQSEQVERPEAFLEPAVGNRLNRLALICPVYRNFLSQFPKSAIWLEDPANRDETFRYSAFKKVWEDEFDGADLSGGRFLWELQRFRRQMSMRIAYREINKLSEIGDSIEELTLLAEFCLQTVAARTHAEWENRLGQPWDEALNRPARFCVLGLGKLGGRELNFCSDLDLIYFFDGEGCCLKDGKPTSASNEYFFAKMFQSLTGTLQERSEYGFLYNIDLRLRPEGAAGPLARSLNAMESYYYARGQTWERLALLRARPVAGDFGLGEEFFESVNPFRYPRHPPDELLSEVAGVKIRTEKELSGESQLENDIKSGYGGIREIEFFVHALQLLHSGKNPFLQVVSTQDTIERLSRYNLLGKSDAAFLNEAYKFLRTVEHRLQMREEKQTHILPHDKLEIEQLAHTLGFSGQEDFEGRISPLREQVRSIYASLFKGDTRESKLQDWTVFLSGNGMAPLIREEIFKWFGAEAEKEAASRLRTFALGSPNYAVTRDQVQLFLNLTRQFDEVLPQLARPLLALERVSRFAESYNARKFFFKTCAANPRFFLSLCLLLDRSEFTTRLLCQHPEIMEEVLVIQNRRHKPLNRLREEMAALPQGKDFPKWLWLYVKAEQVRLSILQLLGESSIEELEASLTLLADAALQHTLHLVDPEGTLAVVGLGKLGAREMTLGSDLDLLLFAEEKSDEAARVIAKRVLTILGHRHPLGQIFEIDLRLRPHGRDGPLVASIKAFRQYHLKSARTWEKQILTRSRFLAGNEQLGREFVELRNKLLYSASANSDLWNEILKMKIHIEKAKIPREKPQRAFKKAPGGLMEIEFFCQMVQLKYGAEIPQLNQANTREVLALLPELQLQKPNQNSILQRNYESLRAIELHLRRDSNKAIDTIDKKSEALDRLAKWMGFESSEEFWTCHQGNMGDNKKIVKNLISEIITVN